MFESNKSEQMWDSKNLEEVIILRTVTNKWSCYEHELSLKRKKTVLLQRPIDQTFNETYNEWSVKLKLAL